MIFTTISNGLREDCNLPKLLLLDPACWKLFYGSDNDRCLKVEMKISPSNPRLSTINPEKISSQARLPGFLTLPSAVRHIS